MYRIEILGIKEHSKSRQLKRQVVQALRVLRMGLPVWDISDVTEIVDSDILGTPALRINGEIIVQQHIPEQEELVVLLKRAFALHQDNIHKKKLIIPTDFLSHSHDAFNYALQLAPFLDASVKVVHVFSSNLPSNDPILNTKASINGTDAILDQLSDFVQKNAVSGQEIAPPSTMIEFEPISGITIPDLLKLSEAENVEMFLMGTNESHNVVEQLLGTVSIAVAQQAYCPVLIIPPGVTFKKYRKILLASNYLAADPAVLKQVSHLATLFQASVHFVHINEKEQKEDGFGQTLKSIVDTLFENQAPAFSFETKTISAATATQGLSNYIEEKDIDLCVFIAPHRNFIERFVHKSLTKQMARYTKIPMLVYHTDWAVH